jgi:hypothetical protein
MDGRRRQPARCTQPFERYAKVTIPAQLRGSENLNWSFYFATP